MKKNLFSQLAPINENEKNSTNQCEWNRNTFQTHSNSSSQLSSLQKKKYWILCTFWSGFNYIIIIYVLNIFNRNFWFRFFFPCHSCSCVFLHIIIRVVKEKWARISQLLGKCTTNQHTTMTTNEYLNDSKGKLAYHE